MCDADATKRGAYALDESSMLYPELWAMHVAWIALASTVALHGQFASARRAIEQAVRGALKAAEEAHQAGETAGPLAVTAEIWQFPDRLRAPGRDEMLIVRDAHCLFLRVSLPDQSPPTQLAFDVVSHAEAESEEQYAEPESHSHRLPDRYLANAWGYIIAAAYERSEQQIVAACGSTANVKAWPSDLQMFFHVRNACSHGGTFDIWKSRKRIDYDRPPRWRDVVLTDEDSVAGKFAIDGLLTPCDAVLFMHDLSRRLDGLTG